MTESLRIRRWRQLNKRLKDFLMLSEVHFLFREPNETEYIYVLYQNRWVIGYAWIEVDDDEAYMYEFEIKSAFRGKGFGKELLCRILNDHPNLSLESTKSSIGFWRKHGFRKWDRENDGLTPMTNIKRKK